MKVVTPERRGNYAAKISVPSAWGSHLPCLIIIKQTNIGPQTVAVFPPGSALKPGKSFSDGSYLSYKMQKVSSPKAGRSAECTSKVYSPAGGSFRLFLS